MGTSLRFSLLLVAMLMGQLSQAGSPPASLSSHTALALILAGDSSEGALAESIQKLQQEIKAKPDDTRRIERLGRLYIAKARLENDPGYYKLAEACGLVLEGMSKDDPQALLLRGHALLAMHQFQPAETIARRLLALRQDMLDHALLGDALMEQGRLDDALPVYQAMIDTKPCLPSYSRIAHMRWLKGDLVGAIDMQQQAVACGSYRDPEPLAWTSARLAHFEVQAGHLDLAQQIAIRAAEIVPDYAPALLVQGRVLLAQNKAAEAAKLLERAEKVNPLPEYQWALADAWRAAGDEAKAKAVEAKLMRHGAVNDPRGFALFLATRGTHIEKALALATEELETRRDVFSHDAVAWAQFAAGKKTEALASSKLALAENTQDARLLLHAGIIALAAKDPAAERLLAQASTQRALLLPSEQAHLTRSLDALHTLSPVRPTAQGH